MHKEFTSFTEGQEFRAPDELAEKWPLPEDGRYPIVTERFAALYHCLPEEIHKYACEQDELNNKKHFLLIGDDEYFKLSEELQREMAKLKPRIDENTARLSRRRRGRY